VTFPINVALSILLAAISWEFFEKRILSLAPRIEANFPAKILAFVSPLLLCIGITLHLLRI
jgi:peptidoglycan/LPS O-acetylase OafA/YrhL